MNTFIERLRQIMSERSISQADLSRLTGLRTSSISDYLTGKYVPKQDKVALIAGALSVSPAWLLGYDFEGSGFSAQTDLKDVLRSASYCTYGGKPIKKELLERLIQAALDDEL